MRLAVSGSTKDNARAIDLDTGLPIPPGHVFYPNGGTDPWVDPLTGLTGRIMHGVLVAAANAPGGRA
jgi:hypothetical protein